MICARGAVCVIVLLAYAELEEENQAKTKGVLQSGGDASILVFTEGEIEVLHRLRCRAFEQVVNARNER